jgi:diguanylate cyclase (GGDEF)-like protein
MPDLAPTAEGNGNDMNTISPVDAARQRTGRLIRLISLTTAIPLLAALISEIFSGVQVVGLFIQVGALATLALATILSRTRYLRVAAWILPMTGWLLANTEIVLAPSVTPMFFASVNLVVALMAGATLGYRGLAASGLLSALAGIALASGDMVEWAHVSSGDLEGWTAASSLYTIALILGFHAFRSAGLSLARSERSATELETLRRAGLAVTASLNLDETIDRILEQLDRVVLYDSASVQVLGDGYLEIVGGHGWDDLSKVVGIRFPIPGDNPNSTLVDTGELVNLDDAPGAYPTFRSPPHDHIRSWLGVPLRAGGLLIGMLSLESTEFAHFSAREERLVSAFADQVALALANAQSYQAEQLRRRRAFALTEINAIMSSTLELPAALDKVAQLTAVAAGADLCALLLQPEGGGEMEIRALQGADGRPADDHQAAVTQTIEGLLASDETAAALAEGQPRTLAAESAVVQAVPLVSRDESLGLLLLLRLDGSDGFGDLAVGAATSVATSLAAFVQNARLFARTEKLSITDPLTGLYNRRGWIRFGQRELERAVRYGRPLSVLILDIDRFKRVNDEHGHPAGDSVLRQLSRLLVENVRSVDLVGRYGGEEFMLLLPECDLASGGEVAERLRRAIEANPFETGADDLHITATIGVTCIVDETTSLDDSLRAADRALFAAKDAGRNRVWSSLPGGEPHPIAPSD